MKKNITKLLALTTVASLTTGLTGCGSIIREDVTKYTLEAPLTTQEVVDYYKKALEYDSVVSKNIEVHEVNYETQDIKGEKAERLKALTEKAEAILGQDTYEITEENLKIMCPDTFNYIKGVIDNEVLTNGKILNIKGSLGYYFVDVEYDVTAKKAGTFNELTPLVGFNGAFERNYDGTYKLNELYLTSVVKELNTYYYKNNIIKNAVLTNGKLEVQDGVAPVVDELTMQTESTDSTIFDTATDPNAVNPDGTENPADTTQPAVDQTQQTEQTQARAGKTIIGVEPVRMSGTTQEEVQELTAEQTQEEQQTTEEAEKTEEKQEKQETKKETKKETKASSTKTEQKQVYGSVTPDDRKIKLDGNEINKVAGSSKSQTATMPDLTTVYNLPAKEGDISGYGIYTAGGNGAKIFGFNRDDLKGKMTLRYVFKDDSEGTGEILGTNVYCIEEEINTGITVSENSILVPEFLQLELEQVIERADRVQVNNDLAGIMSGHLYEDMGVGILRGFREKNTGITKNMSKIVQVIGRDTANNAYALDVETTVIEGAKEVDCYGTYKDKYLVIVQQQGSEFKIVDHVRLSRSVASEPPINPDSTTQKRLVALNLAGEIPEDSKKAIKNLMSTLYTGATNRIASGPVEVKVGGEKVTIEKGIFDCFQTDESILSTDELEYMKSKLVNVVNKNGTDKSIIYSGTVTEWIGGYENQAEFTTEELVTYEGTDTAYYMTVYYLVSCLNDEWVIDERTIMDEYEVENASEVENIKSRLGQ